MCAQYELDVNVKWHDSAVLRGGRDGGGGGKEGGREGGREREGGMERRRG